MIEFLGMCAFLVSGVGQITSLVQVRERNIFWPMVSWALFFGFGFFGLLLMV